jgi:hypothetical protein
VVASDEAVGSISAYLPLAGCGSSEEFVARAGEALRDSSARRAAGAALYETNRALAADGFVERQLGELLTGRPEPPG